MEEKMRMMVITGWMLMILLHCMPFHASLITGDDKEQKLQIRCLPTESHEPVFVPCPLGIAQEAVFHVFMDGTVVHTQHAYIQQCNSLNRSSDLCKNDEDDYIRFNLSGDLFKIEVMYTCNATIKYPPPYTTIQSDRKVLFLKGDHHLCNKTNRNSEEESGENQRFLLIWIVVVALLGTYSLAVTITASVFWVKLRWTDSQNDYMNAKPVTARKQKKKKWVQNPIPRYC
ncbi:uncharacterized protein LOC133425042 [Cololabis saira]|uniref:uncharacterized protein LOC133425042 n=1 Tax=Cololabis saira TaxID=129043 RepID=UPI002AD4E30B|nr:uncharacterized protein LOC133425042 [Cololabis saira]